MATWRHGCAEDLAGSDGGPEDLRSAGHRQRGAELLQPLEEHLRQVLHLRDVLGDIQGGQGRDRHLKRLGGGGTQRLQLRGIAAIALRLKTRCVTHPHGEGEGRSWTNPHEEGEGRSWTHPQEGAEDGTEECGIKSLPQGSEGRHEKRPQLLIRKASG